ncbi:MAG: MATE family efflux transporter, partial [Spirochaetota bacterium]
MAAQSLCSIIDRVYTGHGAGVMAIGGITAALPVVAMFMAFGMLAGTGGSTLYSIRAGIGENTGEKSIVFNTFILLLAVSAALGISARIFLDSILVLCGAHGESFILAGQYLEIMLIALPVQVAGFGMNNFIRAQGHPGISMVTVLIASVGSIVLTPVFLFLLHLGIRGTALAYLCAQLMACVWVVRYFLADHQLSGIKLKNIVPDLKIMKDIVYCGLGSFTIQICSVIVALLFNYQLAHYAKNMGLAAFGIIHCISVFMLMPSVGINQGSQPLIGYNHGSGRSIRVKQIFIKASAISFFTCLIGVCAVMVFPHELIGMFSRDNAELVRSGTEA